MGNTGLSTKQLAFDRAHYEAEKANVARDTRMSLADKIAMVVIDKICNDIIRPGPKAEERECYVMAQELRDTKADLVALISQVLAVDASE